MYTYTHNSDVLFSVMDDFLFIFEFDGSILGFGKFNYASRVSTTVSTKFEVAFQW